MIDKDTISLAKDGNESAIKEIMEEVRYTFLNVLEANKNGFAHKYQIEDFRNEFPSIVWDAIMLYDESRGCSFNTFFHNHVFWTIGKKKKKVALGRFEIPLSGLCEDEETADFLLNNLPDESHQVTDSIIDIDYLRNNDFKLTEQENFLIERVLNGSNMKEAITEFESHYGKSRQWAYVCRDKAIQKIKRHATK